MVQGCAAEYVGSVLGGVWSVGSAGRWADHWSDFAPNVLILSGFPWLKNLSQKCLFLKSLVFRELAVDTEWALKKLNPLFWATELPEKKGWRTKGPFFLKHECSWIIHELTMNWFLEHDCSESELMRHLMRQLTGINGETFLAGSAPKKNWERT